MQPKTNSIVSIIECTATSPNSNSSSSSSSCNPSASAFLALKVSFKLDSSFYKRL